MTDGLISNVAFAILAGGHSSRMGKSKPDLVIPTDLKKRTFLESLCDEFEGFEEKYISVNAGQNYQRDGYIQIVDKVGDIGPLGGIYSVLKQSKAEAVFFLACDMPLYDMDAVKYFLKMWDGKSVAASEVNITREPLAGIYTKNCIDAIEEQIAARKYKLGVLIDKMNGQSIDMSAYKKCFTNINTIEDYNGLGINK